MTVQNLLAEIFSVDLFKELFSTNNLIPYIILSLCNALLLMSISPKFLQIMQQSGYEGFGYFKWLRRRDNVYLSRLSNLTLLSILGFLLFNIFFSFLDRAWGFYIGFVFYLFFAINYYQSDKKREKRVPLVMTARMRRLCVVYYVVLVLATFLIVFLSNVLACFVSENSVILVIRLAPVCITPMLIPVLLVAAHYIILPYETKVQSAYVKKTIKKLHGRPDLIKIAVTGSYGKTSVKEILKTILSEKYEILATPSSYNTPMGICKTVKKLNANHNVFIAEMGARHVGDIKELTEIVKPDYAIINGIVGQHLDTFGNIENIKRTKYEVVESMKTGVVAYTVDNENTIEMFNECKIKTIPSGIDLSKNPSVYATDITSDKNGSTFNLFIDGKCVKCRTSLLGTHNVSNICLASAIAYELGLTLGEISAGISRLTQISHRLEIIEKKRGITIIDDSYNSNVRGIDCALEVLSGFNGRKIIITPGLVEMGSYEDIENYKFGKKIASVCDLVILVGKSAARRMQDGLIDAGFDNDKIIMASSLKDAVKHYNKLHKTGDVLLFENDLPDKFS